MLRRWSSGHSQLTPDTRSRARGVMPFLISIFAGLSLAAFLSLYPARFCDFRAFYCSGQVALAGQDPYREHPLHECEQSLPPLLLSSFPPQLTMPAPYPGYAIALYSVVARLPFNDAIVLWTAASALALCASIGLIARSTSTPSYASVIGLGLPAVIVPLPLGQPTLFVLVAIASCTALLRAERPRLAALAALFTLIEPQVGLAVCCGVFFGVPRTRLLLCSGAVLLLVLDTALFGLARQWEYVHSVLPLHALVNVPEFSQFSIANLAFTAGLGRHPALVLGNLWYGVSLVAGVVVGLRLRSRYGAAAVTFVPVAFSVFGGAHTHLQQLELAIPAFLMVASAADGRRRAIMVASTFVACVPWLIAAPFPYLFVATTVLAVAFAQAMGTARIAPALGASCFIVLCGLCLLVVYGHAPAAAFTAPKLANPLAEVTWGAFVDASSLPARGWYLAGKLPTLAAFIILLGAIAREAWPGLRIRVGHVAVEAGQAVPA
jgi:hypothetical protein